MHPFRNEAQAKFQEFLSSVNPGRPLACVCHNDVDGLAAAVLVHHALESRTGINIIPTRKAETAWSPRIQDELKTLHPGGVITCDLSPREAVVYAGAPNLVLDHHRPEGAPADTVLITGYGKDPVPTSGVIAYWSGSAAADLSRFEWIAGLSVIGDLADETAFLEAQRSRRRFAASVLRECVSLLNAARRVGDGDATAALRLLLRAQTPLDLLRKEDADVQMLFAAREHFQSALAGAKRAAPRFSGNVALILTNTDCQVHPVIAQIWRSRLRKYIVIAANSGYRNGYVHFSVRSASGTNLIEFLNRHRPKLAGEDFARGHNQATGGSITTLAWEEFLQSLGFNPTAKSEVAA